jgi:hypothetical protein
MKLPFWHHSQPDPNPNGFYPEPRPIVHLCECVRCAIEQWTFTPVETLDFIADHMLCPALKATPATAEYLQMVRGVIVEAHRTIGPRT